jgi:Cache 3/Cache 2 fusion domain
MRQNDADASYSARSSVRTPAATRASARERRRSFKRLRLHRQFVPLLVLVTLLSTAGIAGLSYIGARSAALANAQTRAAQDAQVLRDELTARGAPLRLSDGRFVVGTGATALTLNDDTSIVDHTRALLSADASIYELEGTRLVAVSTTIPATGARDLGDTLPANITFTLLSSCGPAAPSTCYQPYGGVATLAGRQYVVDAIPLFDANGTFVGAVSAALPLDAILAPTVQLTVVLLLVGALLALISLAGGIWIYGARVESVLDRLDSSLNRLADTASDLEHLAHTQVDRSGRQSSVARQVAEQVRALDAMAQVMEQGHVALRDSTTEMWTEIAQPGITPDIALTTRLAQQTAVTSARVGSAAEDARDLCRQLVTQMNHIAAEAGMMTDSGHALEQGAQDLRARVEGVEITLGERLRKRMLGSSLPLIRRVRAASLHLRWLQSAQAEPVTDMRPGASHEDTATANQLTKGRYTGSLRAWQDDAGRVDSPPQSPVNPSIGVWLSGTGRHITPPRISGTPRPGAQRPASSDDLPPTSRDVIRGDPAASFPRAPHPPRYPYDTGNPGGGRSSGHSPPSGWLGE